MNDDTRPVIDSRCRTPCGGDGKSGGKKRDFKKKALDEYAVRTMGAGWVPGFIYVAFLDQALRAIRRANHQWPRRSSTSCAAFVGAKTAEQVAQHGNDREPSDGTPMIAERPHESKLGRASMPVNR